MGAIGRSVVTIGALAFGGAFVVHGAAQLRATIVKRHQRAACPFEDDEHDVLSPLRALQLVWTESVLWLWIVLTAPLRPHERARGATPVPVLVLPPRWLPRAAVRLLVARLARDGFAVLCADPAPRTGSRAARVAGVDAALRACWERTGAQTVDVIATASAAPALLAHLAGGGSGTPQVRRLLTVGAAGAEGPPPPRETETIALYSQDDPFLVPAERGRRPGALNIAVRGLGRLGLLHAPHVYELVREHLTAPPVQQRASR